VLVNEDSMMM